MTTEYLELFSAIMEQFFFPTMPELMDTNQNQKLTVRTLPELMYIYACIHVYMSTCIHVYLYICMYTRDGQIPTDEQLENAKNSQRVQ